MRAPAHTVLKHQPRTPAQHLLMELDSLRVRCPVHDIELPKFGGWWFGHGYLELRATGRAATATVCCAR